MSPQDKVERVLKEIHVMFSKCETYDSHPDKIIVDRRKFLGLLDQLNQGIFEMMDRYEQTRASREQAEREFRNKGKAIMEDASEKADDIYASSVLYTADMLGRVQELIDQANDSMADVFRMFKRELREQKNLVKSHELELESQLHDLSDTKTYEQMLEDVRRRQRLKHNQEALPIAQGKEEKQPGEHIYTPAVSAEIKINETYFEKAGISPEDAKAGYVPEPDGLKVEKPDVKVNLDAEYFKRKAALAQQDSAQEAQSPVREAELLTEDGSSVAEEQLPAMDEEAIRQAVLEDERQAMLAEEGKKEPVPGWKKRLKNLIQELAPKDEIE